MASPVRTKKPLRVRYHFGLVLIAVIVIFGLFFYDYMKNTTLEEVLSEGRSIYVPALSSLLDGSGDNDESSVADESDAEERISEKADVSNPVAECEPFDSEYLDSCVFIGDSIMYGLSSYGIVSPSNVYASLSMNISKVETETVDTPYGEMTILEALKRGEPDNIYIMLGTNGAAWLTADDMIMSLKSFVTKVISACPNAEIYLISAPPVTAGAESSLESPISNDTLDSYNSLLLKYADTANVHYLDLNTYLKDGGSSLPSDYAENDGVHLKYSTYELIVDYILSHVA